MYQLLVERLLGVNRLGDSLLLKPLFPSAWTHYKVHYRFRQTVYHITFNRITDKALPSLLLDGIVCTDCNRLPLKDDRHEHFVELFL
jgi:cellobiose phosphorylase